MTQSLPESFAEFGEARQKGFLRVKEIKEQERYILLARVIEEKSFSQIAGETGLSYKGAAAAYYRTLERLRKLLGGGRRGF